MFLPIFAKLPYYIKRLLIPNMQILHIANDPNKVQLARLGHVYFEHPNLSSFSRFALDFSFVEEKRIDDKIYYRSYSRDPFIYVASQSRDRKSRFNGPAFVAASKADFDKALDIVGGVQSDLGDSPGGGRMVTFNRSDSIEFHVIYGQAERDTSGSTPSATHEFQGPYNGPFQKPRKGTFQRYHEGPALVHKVGHLGLVLRDFDEELEWYTSNFNFTPTDILYHPDFNNVDVLTFMHLDLGKEFSDHHVLFLQRVPPETKKSYMHHTSYEVADFDEQLIGHEWLAKQGWKSVWGVGRHVLGSQIFDYWSDPSGFKIKHYADGDLVNEDTPTERSVVGLLSIWGPELPRDFGEDASIT